MSKKMAWRYGRRGAARKIWGGSLSEIKPEFADDGRTKDDWLPPHGSTSADKQS